MTPRRTFLAAGAALAAFRPDAAARVARAAAAVGDAPPDRLADDENYWGEIQRSFDTDRTIINLNNGGVCPTPTHVLEQMVRDLKFSNESPVEHMWRVLQPRIEMVRRELAREFGCDPEEMAVTRNATEAMTALIFGIDLKAGDEVIVTDQNYPHMRTAWDQRVRRDKIVLKVVPVPAPLTTPETFVVQVADAITTRTKAIELPHVTNWCGQVLPVADVVKLGREKGVEVFIDGAHGFAQLPFKRDDLDCDYYGTSLHKWLLAPIGTGFLYVRKSKIASIWPLMSSSAKDEDVRKFEEIGTHPQANFNAIAVALAFHRSIGVDRKLARLRYLRDRWARPLLAADPRVKVWTPIDDDALSGGIALVKIEGVDIGALYGHLHGKYRIVTSPTKHPTFEGVRVSANVYTTPAEIDVFTEAMMGVLAKGV